MLPLKRYKDHAFLVLLLAMLFLTSHQSVLATSIIYDEYVNISNRLENKNLRKNHKSSAIKNKTLNSKSWGFDWTIEQAPNGYVFLKNRLNGNDKYLRQDFNSKNLRAIPIDEKSWGFYWILEYDGNFVHIKNRLSGQYLKSAFKKDYVIGDDLTHSWSFDWQIQEKLSSPSPTPTPVPTPVTAPLHELVNNEKAIDATRFLTQATFGPKEETIKALMIKDYFSWIDEQISTPQTNTLALLDERIRLAGMDPLVEIGSEVGLKTLQRSDVLWDTWVNQPDQLRQKVAYALSQIFVISNMESTISRDVRGIADYHDTLAQHAFGNFRDLLQDVALHQMMGEYLSMIRNEKADEERNIRPDENFARELMQLFTLGLRMLNEDGTFVTDNDGNTIPTYNQDTIDSFSRVFTGWTYAEATDWRWRDRDEAISETLPMKAFEEFHDTDEKTLLNGQVLPANQTALEDLNGALDNIFAHQNVGPFISKQLIQRLITSNPTPAYVGRVARVFNNNGEGVKGDLGAVIKAILLDDEARTGHLTLTHFGKIREPILMTTALFRAFNAEGMFPTKDEALQPLKAIRVYRTERAYGQRPYGAFSVFNFYRPDYSPTGPLRSAGLSAPEFQILDDSILPQKTNMFNRYAFSDKDNESRSQTFNHNAGFGNVNLDYSREKELAFSPYQLIDRLNLLLLAGQMNPETRSKLVKFIIAVPLPADEPGMLERIVTETVHMISITPEFSFQN